MGSTGARAPSGGARRVATQPQHAGRSGRRPKRTALPPPPPLPPPKKKTEHLPWTAAAANADAAGRTTDASSGRLIVDSERARPTAPLRETPARHGTPVDATSAEHRKRGGSAAAAAAAAPLGDPVATKGAACRTRDAAAAAEEGGGGRARAGGACRGRGEGHSPTAATHVRHAAPASGAWGTTVGTGTSATTAGAAGRWAAASLTAVVARRWGVGTGGGGESAVGEGRGVHRSRAASRRAAVGV